MVNSLHSQQHCVEDQPPLAKKMKMHLTAIPKEIRDDLQYNLIDVKLLQRNILDRSDFILLNSYATNDEKIEILMELLRNKTEEDHNNFLEIMEEDYKWLRDKCEIFLQKIRLDALKNGTKTRLPLEDPVIDCQDPNATEENDRSTVEIKSPSSLDSIVIPQRPKSKGNLIKKEKDDKISVSTPVKDRTNMLSQPVTSEMMTIVRRNHRVVRKWSTLAHVLGMTSIVHTLRMRMVINGEDAESCILHLLEEWKGARPKEASLEKLILVLREEDFNDVADELEEQFVS